MNRSTPTIYAKLITVLFLGCCSSSVAQLNNAIYNGGAGQGVDVAFVFSPTNNSIFTGNQDDGFTKDGQLTSIHNSIYPGGMDDGFLAVLLQENVYSDLFHGGEDDGWSAESLYNIQNNVIWTGRVDDGWSSKQMSTQTNSVVFNGGSDDGFSNSGISKMRWTGTVSSEWLMASNWTPNIVPGIHDAAWIPQVRTHYPILKTGMLGLSLQKTYSCKELHIEPLASVTLNQEVGLVSNGYLCVKGTLNVLGVGLSNFVILEGAILDVKLGGSLNVEKL